MTTPQEVTVGTNAAVPAATEFVNSFVPDFYQTEVDAKIPQLTAIIVAAAIPAVDAYRVANHPVSLKEKAMQGWRTLIVAVAIAIAGVLQTFNWATVIPQDQKWTGMAMLLIGGIIAFLRYITTTPIGTSSSK